MGDKSYMNFGFDIEYVNTCRTCKSSTVSTDNQQSTSYTKILDVPLPFIPQNKPEVNMKKVLKEIFSINQVKDYTCEKCQRNDLTMNCQSTMIRLPNVMIFSFQRKMFDSNELTQRINY